MAKVKVKDEKSSKEAKEKLQGTVDFRKTKRGVIVAKQNGQLRGKNQGKIKITS
ncbi:MAG: hypothetical protein ACKKMW_01895 [Candidatus Nealsonbacteria bacterium]